MSAASRPEPLLDTVAAVSRRALALLAAIAVAGSLSACGGDEEREGAGAAVTGTETGATGEATQPTGAPVATISVREMEFELDPANPRIDETGTVLFEISNEGEVEHNLEVETPQGEFELEENIAPGESATLEVELSEPGEYVWYCPVGNHRELGMEGRITVAGGGSGGNGGEGEDGDAGASGGGTPGY